MPSWVMACTDHACAAVLPGGLPRLCLLGHEKNRLGIAESTETENAG